MVSVFSYFLYLHGLRVLVLPPLDGALELAGSGLRVLQQVLGADFALRTAPDVQEEDVVGVLLTTTSHSSGEVSTALLTEDDLLWSATDTHNGTRLLEIPPHSLNLLDLLLHRLLPHSHTGIVVDVHTRKVAWTSRLGSQSRLESAHI